MNKTFTHILVSLFLICTLNISHVSAKIIVVGSQNEVESNKITRGDVFIKFASSFKDEIPTSYKYIQLNFFDVNEGTQEYEALQKLVYLDLIQNSKTKLHLKRTLDTYTFLKLAEKVYGVNFVKEEQIEELKKKNVTENDFIQLDYRLNKSLNDFKKSAKNKSLLKKKAIFVDAYNTILSEHYDNETIDEQKVLEYAIEGITKATNDKHTVYFPAVDSKDFYESLNGEYEGIGAYVDMEKPGAVRITSPIKGAPSEKAGLKGGDLVIKVDGKEINETNSLKEVISWIKGPAGSKVRLTIDRSGDIFDVDVTREKIIIKDVESKLLDRNTYYIEIKSFGDNVSQNFKAALKDLKERNNVKKIIIDLRSNGGGFLGEVADMLSYFVEKDSPTAVVKYMDGTKKFYSRGYDLIDFSKYKIVILQNSGTASASEIMIGTIKDYYPDATIIGENSYGKGSVQTIRQYSDGSSLKYTIAKWFTGKTETGIDGVGIQPTIELEFDIDKYKKYDIDNQLDKARTIR